MQIGRVIYGARLAASARGTRAAGGLPLVEGSHECGGGAGPVSDAMVRGRPGAMLALAAIAYVISTIKFVNRDPLSNDRHPGADQSPPWRRRSARRDSAGAGRFFPG